MNKISGIWFGAFLLLLIITAGCEQTPVPPADKPVAPPGFPLDVGTYEEQQFMPDKEVKTLTFKSDEELAAFFRQQSSGMQTGGRPVMMRSDNVRMQSDMVLESTDATFSGAPASGKALEFSETNVQVEGIDEADIIKTDGNYIYTITDKTLYVILAYPGEEARIISTISFNSRPSGLFIQGDRLAVFGSFHDADWYRKVDFTSSRSLSFFDVYDISDRQSPELVKDYKFEGNYFNARMKDGFVYFVVRSTPNFFSGPVRPVIFEGTEQRMIAVSDIHYFNIPYQNPQFVTVHAFNIKDRSADSLLLDSATVTVEHGQNMYMSHNNIYVTYSEYINEWDIERQVVGEIMQNKISQADKELIQKIKLTDDAVLSRYEKDQKIYSVYQSYMSFIPDEERESLQDEITSLVKKRMEAFKHLEYTIINRIGISEGKVSVEANGKVPGSIINQFSMDEHDSVFRIATTINTRWQRWTRDRAESTNNVYTLNMDLAILGELEGLAEGETIYSARFMGDKLYMVTFRQIDPFFVIDLANPRNPKALGELKIPGFSRYLHPYDEHTIIGIGQEATDTGRTTGLKISLFDVSDFANPVETAKFVTDERYAQSSALYEHKAFLFDREKQLLVIPAYSYDYRGSSGSSAAYNGAFVFKITRNQIMLRGLIDHSHGSTVHYAPQVERSLWIDELLYTKSPSLLRINRIEDLSSVKNLTLATTGKIPVY